MNEWRGWMSMRGDVSAIGMGEDRSVKLTYTAIYCSTCSKCPAEPLR